MSTFYRWLAWPLLKRMDPERAHHFALGWLRRLGSNAPGRLFLKCWSGPHDPRLRVSRFGLGFNTPLGVAAGLDKDADAVRGLLALGFGAVEIGTVTPKPQPGNDKPRVWRLVEQRALINKLGFPSEGMDAVAAKLEGVTFPGIVGANIGKNKDTPIEKAVEDYVACHKRLAPFVHYVVVNISSPNTPQLRELQNRKWIAGTLKALPTGKPVLVKLAPDLDDAALDEALGGIADGGAAGVIVSNTTIDRSSVPAEHKETPGGLSGEPLKSRATQMVREVRKRAGPNLPIIGVGGIATAEDAIERMKAGACLVQLYTGFVYGGPGLPGRIVKGLRDFVERERLKSIEEIIGVQ